MSIRIARWTVACAGVLLLSYSLSEARRPAPPTANTAAVLPATEKPAGLAEQFGGSHDPDCQQAQDLMRAGRENEG